VFSNLSKAEKIELARLLDEKIARNKRNKLKRQYESLYQWQRKFIAATKTKLACCLMASNQCGKTRTGVMIDAYHLTGEYPDDWEGHRYDFPPLLWLLGYSGEKTRDLLQQKLFGRLLDGVMEGGLIPADKIIDYLSMTGTPRAAREVRVKHKLGISTVQFWSYGQGQHAIMGDVVDGYHIDEEPEDHEIFPQVLTRTLNGDRGRGGRGILTFTPENGMTELIRGFMETPSESDYLQGATWDECPHITPEKKELFLSKYPAYQRDMRTRGLPLMGAGLIFEIDENLMKVDPFSVPKHWFVINGMDFGWDHPQAHIQLVWDRDSDTYYIVNAWKMSKKQPFEAWHCVKPWAEDIPTAWPADGLQHEKGSAKQQKSYYEDEGWCMLPDSACWEDGGNGVWAGIAELNDAMKTGRFKIFSNLVEVFEEIRQYHTTMDANQKSHIVKVKDDLIDAIRYAYMMRRYAIRIMDINMVYNGQNVRREGRDTITGY